MNKPLISLIAAIGKNRELGRGNKLLFEISEDMRFFREKTRGHSVIMGRKTYESIGKPLPNRTNIIVTQNSEFRTQYPAVKIVHSFEEAIELAKTMEREEIFVIGGAQIYSLAMPFADRLYLTLVDAEVADADAFFPEYKDFKNVVFKKQGQDSHNSYTFLTLTP